MLWSVMTTTSRVAAARLATQSASGADAPFLAERLLRRELQVQAILQEWEPGCEAWSGYFLEMPHPRAVAALEATLGVAAVQPLETPETIVDGVVVWECGVETR